MESRKNTDISGENDYRSLARQISIVENEIAGYENILAALKINYSVPVIGFTGPPGAGKSTLINSLLGKLSSEKKIAVIAVDPSSPFTQGSLLGDRLRMAEQFQNKKVFIRSLASRGALGGLSAKTIEITDLIRSSDFDFVFVETVGVGQSEVEIASLADTTVLVLNPNSGDDVQAIKSGIIEVADILVVNKSDHDNADILVKHLLQSLHLRPYKEWQPPVIKTIATTNEGIDELISKIQTHQEQNNHHNKIRLFTSRAYKLIEQHRMKDIDVKELENKISAQFKKPDFNMYRFLKETYL